MLLNIMIQVAKEINHGYCGCSAVTDWGHTRAGVPHPLGRVTGTLFRPFYSFKPLGHHQRCYSGDGFGWPEIEEKRFPGCTAAPCWWPQAASSRHGGGSASSHLLASSPSGTAGQTVQRHSPPRKPSNTARPDKVISQETVK